MVVPCLGFGVYYKVAVICDFSSSFSFLRVASLSLSLSRLVHLLTEGLISYSLVTHTLLSPPLPTHRIPILDTLPKTINANGPHSSNFT